MLVDVEKVQRITFHGRSCCYQLVNYRSRCRRPRRPSKNRLAKYSISFFGCQTALPSAAATYGETERGADLSMDSFARVVAIAITAVLNQLLTAFSYRSEF